MYVCVCWPVCGKIWVNFTMYNILRAIRFSLQFTGSCECVCFSFANQCVGFADEMYINIYDFCRIFCFIATLYNDLWLTCCWFLQIV